MVVRPSDGNHGRGITVGVDNDEFLNDDGLSHIVEGGLALHISYDTTDTNQCRLRAHIE